MRKDSRTVILAALALPCLLLAEPVPREIEPTGARPTMADIIAIRRELVTEEIALRKKAEVTDAELAALAVKCEKLMERQQKLTEAARKEYDTPEARAERHAFQERLAAATTPEERKRIFRERAALQQVEILEKSKQ